MQQTRKFRFATAGATRVIAMSTGALALACSSNHTLGDLAPDDLLEHPAGDSPATGQVGPT